MKNSISKALLISAMITAVAGFAVTAQAADMEKCAGVAKAGKNDCKSASNSCAGQAKDGGWVSVPKGLCEKLVGGSVVK